MYTPKDFRNENKEELLRFVRQNSFGLLIGEVDGKPWATHIPFSLNEAGDKLTAHVARGNKQWKHFSSEKELLAVFHGPHTYISSSWYDHENVPTWNYIAVHVYGKVRIIEGEELKASLKQLVDHYEAASENPVSIEKMTPSYLEKEIRSIVAFEMAITSIEASYKLSQNRDKKNHDNIVKELEKRNDPDSTAIANEMSKRFPD